MIRWHLLRPPATESPEASPLPIQPEPDPASAEPGGDSDGLDAVWEQALESLAGQMTKATFEAHLKRARPVGFDGGTLTIQAVNSRSGDWLENRLKPIISRALASVIGGAVRVAVV